MRRLEDEAGRGDVNLMPAIIAAVQAYAREQLEAVRPQLLGAGPPDRGVVTSKTFRSLARLDGAAPAFG
ncbi:MAG: hypothetical protein KY433_12770 [Actinobacteria bacterium]|nr:hypothetical protein [Actinomycetota bacterium]